MNKEDVIGLIEKYAQTQKPPDITVEVIGDEAHFDGKVWHLPVRTNYNHPKQYPFYNKLDKIEKRLLNEENLNVMFAPVEPMEITAYPAETKLPVGLDVSKPRKAEIIALVQKYAQEEEPTEVEVEVLGKGARRDGKTWCIPVRTDHAMPNRSRYYEKLADIEMRLYDENNVNVMLVPS